MTIATLLLTTLVFKMTGSTGPSGMVAAISVGSVICIVACMAGDTSFGSKELAAPQASLMKMIVEGVMDGNLPWALILIGVCIAIVIEIFKIPVLPVAIGLYLPLELSTTIMIVGIIRWVTKKRIIQERITMQAPGFCIVQA